MNDRQLMAKLGLLITASGEPSGLYLRDVARRALATDQKNSGFLTKAERKQVGIAIADLERSTGPMVEHVRAKATAQAA